MPQQSKISSDAAALEQHGRCTGAEDARGARARAAARRRAARPVAPQAGIVLLALAALLCTLMCPR